MCVCVYVCVQRRMGTDVYVIQCKGRDTSEDDINSVMYLNRWEGLSVYVRVITEWKCILTVTCAKLTSVTLA